MFSKKELQFVQILTIVLLVVGVVCYAAFSANPPEEPVRIVFENTAGQVMFTHQTHASDSGYGISCGECHHHFMEEMEDMGNGMVLACGECHQLDEEGNTVTTTCEKCHESDYYEDMEMSKRSGAFHSQCIGCHKDNDAGPVTCASCHPM